MIKLWDAENVSVPILSLSGESETASSCAPCEAFRPHPQLSGNLQVDPEIHLPSPGMNLDIAYFYNASSPINGPFGYGRTISAYQAVQASGSPTIVTATRGNGAVVTFQDSGNGVIFLAQIPSVLTSFTKDTTNHLWKEKTLDGFTFAYPLDTTGQISSLTYIEDPVGNRHTYSYVSGRLAAVQDVVGRFVSFGYNASNLLQSIQDWAGRRTTFAYDSATAPPLNLLTTITGPTGCQTAYQYTSFTISTFINTNGYDYLLSGITDPNGYATSYTYDQQKRVTSRELPLVGITTYLYTPGVTTTYQGGVTYSYQSMLIVDAYSGITTHTAFGPQFAQLAHADASGVMLSFTRNSNLQEIARQNLDGAIWTTAYDNLGNVSGTVDPLGYVTTLQRDAYNNVAAIQYADGSMVTHVWGYAGSGFDTSGARRRLQAVVDPLGNRTSYSYTGRGQLSSVQDALGNRMTHGYDAWGNHISVTDALGYVTTRTYDSAGNVVAGIDPLGHATSTTYDPQNRPLTVMNALGNVSTRAYDSVGNPIIHIDPLGNRTTYSYNIFNTVVAVQNPLGNVWTNVYDNLGRQAASIDPLGNIATTVYDAAGRTAAQMDALGSISSTIYDMAGRAQSSMDALGNTTTTVYDTMGRVLANVNALGNITSFGYDTTNRQVSVQDALGYVSTSVYDLAGKPIASVDALGDRSTTIYDAANRVVASVDALGYRSTTLYDAANRVIARLDALGFCSSYGYDSANRQVSVQDALGRVSTAVYDAAGKSIASVDALGNRSTTVYNAVNRTVAWVDPLGRMVTSLYDAAHRAISNMDMLGFISTTVYDSASRVVAIIDALGFRNSYGYDTTNRRVSSQDALGHISTSIYDSLNRRLANQDALGNLSTIIYDSAGRSITLIDPLNRYSTTVYDAANRAIASVDALGFCTSYGYDSNGQQVSVQDANGNLATNIYDAIGRQVASVEALGYRTSYTYDAVGQQVAMRDALGYLSTTVYDGAGQITANIDPLGNSSTTLYDLAGRSIASIDALGNTATTIYDAASEVIASQDARGYFTTFIYDPRGLQTALVDANGHRTSMNYDRRSLMTSQQDALGVFMTYSYDGVGNTSLRVDGNNRYTTYAYDALDREIGRFYFDSTRATFTFDAAGQQLSMQDVSGTTASTYDLVGQEQSVTATNGSVFTYTYDGVGNRLGLQGLYINDFNVPNRTTLLTTYAYDANNRLASLWNGFNERTTFAYDALDRDLTRTLANGQTIQHTYDPAGRETVLANLKAGGAALAIYTNTYDSVGNCLSVQEMDGSRVTFSYDATYQLINEQRSKTNVYNATYTYDGLGNRLTKVDSGARTTYAYNAANALTLLTPPTGMPTTYTYDGAGNLAVEKTTLPPATYTWDGENRLLSLSTLAGGNGTTEQYGYSADDLRKTKNVSLYTGGTVGISQYAYVWDGQNVAADNHTNGTTRFTNAPDTWGELISVRNSSTSSYYGNDSQSSVRLLVSQNGTITDRYNYRAFGEAFGGSGTTYNPYRYIGTYGYYQDNANRYYVRARHLNVALGRWISRDPIGFDGGDWNLYRYVANAPTKYNDPSGSFTDCTSRTASYCQDAYAKRGLGQDGLNYGKNCFCYVSGHVCSDIIKRGGLKLHIEDIVSSLKELGVNQEIIPHDLPCVDLLEFPECAKWTDCINSCLYNTYARIRKGGLNAGDKCWDKLDRSGACDQPKLKASEANRVICCNKMVECEQTRYGECYTGECAQFNLTWLSIAISEAVFASTGVLLVTPLMTCADLITIGGRLTGQPYFPFSSVDNQPRIQAAQNNCCKKPVWKTLALPLRF